MNVRYFTSALEFRAWLERHHTTETELWVGYYKKPSGKPSIRWPESVGEALCYGWIDGIRRRVDGERYTIRFTPRRRGSTWSAINIARAEELARAGRLRPAGASAFLARRANRSGIYSYEQRPAQLPEPYQRRLRRNRAAWGFYQEQPPGYRKRTSWWVLSAKQEPTRLRRLEKLTAACARGERV